jgi:hypothetical protein
MTIINNKYKFIFIHIPKTAGTSLSVYYGQIMTPIDVEIGGSAIGEILQPYYMKRFGINKHSAANTFKYILGDKVFNDYYKFCFVRNPFDRIVSVYKFLKTWLPNSMATEHAKIFENFNSLMDMLNSEYWQNTPGVDNMFQPQAYWVLDVNNKMLVDYVGRVENIVTDIHALNKSLNLELPMFDISLNQSLKNKENITITKGGIELIKNRYAIDFDTFNYSEKFNDNSTV